MLPHQILRFLLLTILILTGPDAFALGKGDMLLPFSGQTLDGKTLSMGTAIGVEPVMLVFWASWCPNCEREMPGIEQLLLTEAGKDLRVITVNVGYNDSETRARQFMERTGIDYPVIYDRDSRITKQHGILGVPTIIIGDRRGRIVFWHNYVPDGDLLATLLAED